MSDLIGSTAVVTGGTDGIGAATALELRRRGADVPIIGRSRSKADALVGRAQATDGPGSVQALIADLSLMRTTRDVATALAQEGRPIDILVNAAGILISRSAHTSEGIELDFAVSYLARFVLLETLAAHDAFSPTARVVSIAASSRTVPAYARMEFDDLTVVEAGTGMKSHGQAQLANDLLIAQAAQRYGITAIGYGPGSVDTNIRREVPAIVRAIMKPFFARRTRSPEDVAHQLVDIITDDSLSPADTAFFDRTGRFPTAEFIADPTRQRDLMEVSLTLSEKALAAR